MQDIVFYAAANETLGIVRDYANVRNQSAPVLTLGVSVCLRIRLFAATEGAASYPITSFNGITEWIWRMDGDFDRSTACKLIADESGISVHTVTDTVNGETKSFTEFVIPISNMNTQELAAWIGTEKTRSGLTGELVGYDSSENAAFVLQIENFTVRNRVGGLADPTALDQGTVTRTQAERMIQSAVSSSAATKQDLLTSANAGTGISVTSAGIISVSDVPQSAVAGLESSLAGKQNTLTAGYRTAIVNGSTVDQARYFAIEPAITAPANQTTSVVLSAGRAYEIHAVATNAKVLLNREEPVGGAHTFGLEGHAEIFVANTGYIQTGEHVVLSEPLEPDAINYCTVRFRRDMAVISVEDHIGGYIAVSATGTSSGSLAYGLASAGSQYIAFDASLNGRTLDMGGTVTSGEKHVVGNGFNETVLTGGVSCTGKTTFANLSMSGAFVSGGSMTLGDVRIPSGATVTVRGGGLAVERVTGDSGTIDLGASRITVGSGQTAVASGVSFVSGGVSSSSPGAFLVTSGGSMTLIDCDISNNTASYAAAMSLNGLTEVVLSGCSIHDNLAAQIAGIAIGLNSAPLVVRDCEFGNMQDIVFLQTSTQNSVTLGGSMTMLNRIYPRTTSFPGTVSIESGAVIDLTGNSNAAPIAPGGAITIPAEAVVLVLGSGGSSGYFSELALTGSTITNAPAVLGATVTIPASGGPWDVEYADGTSETFSAGETERAEVLSGAVVYIGEQ